MPEYDNPKLRTPPPLDDIRIAKFSSPAVSAVEPAYAELAVTSNFSFLRGASHPDELVRRAAELGYRAIAITDHNTLAGAVRMHMAAKAAGLKLLVGSRLILADHPALLVWASDRPAYSRLCRLLTLGKRRAAKGQCQLFISDVLDHSEGLFAAVIPPYPPHALGDDFLQQLCRLRDAFGHRISLAAACSFDSDPRFDLQKLQHISLAAAVPLLATNDVHYHSPDRRPLQDVLTCIRLGCTVQSAGRQLFANAERYLKSPAQMHSLWADYPHALRRALHIAQQCTFSLDELRYEYPAELTPPGQTPIEYLTDLAWQGAARRYPHPNPPPEYKERGQETAAPSFPSPCTRPPSHAPCTQPFSPSPCTQGRGQETAAPSFPSPCTRPPSHAPCTQPFSPSPCTQGEGRGGGSSAAIPDKVRQLIEHELKLIAELRIEAYFLTVYDLVRFARSRGILCQGRGSAANSAVCYCLGVTSVDPTRIDLLFERFVSAARNEPPDIDIDVEHERREEVLQYLYEKYGRDRAGMTAEIISYRGRSAVRDVGKALGLDLDTVDQMAKRLDGWDRGTIDDRHIKEAGLDPDDPIIRHVIHLTGQLLGFPRHLSQHVGGMVMTRGLLCDLVPIENAAMPGRTVIEWDKYDIDDLGILKVDVLALGMLTCIAKAMKLVQPSSPSPCTQGEGWGGGFSVEPPDLASIPAEDPAVYDMVCQADTVGVFQIESRAQMSMLPRLRPRTFYDLVIEVAIVRPGPIQGDMVHPYLRRRSGLEPVHYPSDELRDVLGKTLGVPLFQEQAMRIAMVAAGFSAQEADQFRRAMAAWKRSGGIDVFQRKIIDGMLANGYSAEYADQCFNQLRGFGEYGFPESHAASFALLVYASAWLKRYHPAAFCCALLNSQPMGFYAPAQIVRDALAHCVPVLPVDVQSSDVDCTLCPRPRTSSSPLLAIADVKPRWNFGQDGPAVRLGFRMVRGLHQSHAEKLVAARARIGRVPPFDSIDHFCRSVDLPAHAMRLLAAADAFSSMGIGRRAALWELLRQRDDPMPLFHDAPDVPQPAVPLPAMPLQRQVAADYQLVGLSLKRHPLALIRPALSEMKILTAADLANTQNGKWVRVAGIVLVRQRPGTAAGIVFATLEDETGVVNLIIRPAIYERFRAIARHSRLLRADGPLQREGQVQHVLAAQLCDLSELLDCQTASRDFH